jgi:hypothetical protein
MNKLLLKFCTVLFSASLSLALLFGCSPRDASQYEAGEVAPSPRGTTVLFGRTLYMNVDGNGKTISNVVIGAGSVWNGLPFSQSIASDSDTIDGYHATNLPPNGLMSNAFGSAAGWFASTNHGPRFRAPVYGGPPGGITQSNNDVLLVFSDKAWNIGGDGRLRFWTGLFGQAITFWNDNNDGGGSGLNADLIDGYHATNLPPNLLSSNLVMATGNGFGLSHSIDFNTIGYVDGLNSKVTNSFYAEAEYSGSFSYYANANDSIYQQSLKYKTNTIMMTRNFMPPYESSWIGFGENERFTDPFVPVARFKLKDSSASANFDQSEFGVQASGALGTVLKIRHSNGSVGSSFNGPWESTQTVITVNSVFSPITVTQKFVGADTFIKTNVFINGVLIRGYTE